MKNDGAVENLWMTGANPVENLTTQNFLSLEWARSLSGRHVDAPFVLPFA
jgi:hypothetical protein